MTFFKMESVFLILPWCLLEIVENSKRSLLKMTVISVTAIPIIIGYISSFALNIKSTDKR